MHLPPHEPPHELLQLLPLSVVLPPLIEPQLKAVVHHVMYEELRGLEVIGSLRLHALGVILPPDVSAEQAPVPEHADHFVHRAHAGGPFSGHAGLPALGEDLRGARSEATS